MIPNVVGNIAGGAQAQRFAVNNQRRAIAANEEAARKAAINNVLQTLLQGGVTAAIDFGRDAYREATSGARDEQRLASDLAQVKRQNEASDVEFAATYPELFKPATPSDVAGAVTPPENRQPAIPAPKEFPGLPEIPLREGAAPVAPTPRPAPPVTPAPLVQRKPYGEMSLSEQQQAIAQVAAKRAADAAAAKAEQTKWDRSKLMEQEKTKRNTAAVSANVAPVKYDKYGNALMTRPKTFTGTSDSEWGGLVEYKPTEVQQPVRAGGSGGAGGTVSMPPELADVKLTLQYANVDKRGRPDGKTISVNAFNGPAIVRILRSTPIQFNLTPAEAASVLDAYQAGNFDVANRMLVASTEALSKGKANIGQAATTSDVDVKRNQELDDARKQAKADLEADKAERAQSKAYADADKQVRAQFVAYLTPEKPTKKNQFRKAEPALPPPINGVQMTIEDTDAAMAGAEPLDPAKKPGYDHVKAVQAAARAKAAGKVAKPKAAAPKAVAPAPQAAPAAAPAAPAKSGRTNANGVPLSDPRIQNIIKRANAGEIKKADLDDWIDGIY